MEKVVYALSGPFEHDTAALSERLRGEVTAGLVAAGAHGVQVNVADGAVDAAASLRIASSAAPAVAVVSVWIDSAVESLRRPFDEVIKAVGGTAAAYLVTESVPLTDASATSAPGERTDGFAQIAFFRRPAQQGIEEWLDLWLNHHTPIAIETQHTFLYVQNVVTRSLTPGAPEWHAIVEECFPAAAMTDPHVFFDAVGDDARLERHQQVMFDSVQRFIDLSSIDVVPTSRYVTHTPFR